MDFPTAILDLEACGFLLLAREVSGECWSAGPTVGWSQVALELSKRVGGQVWPTETGATWLCGRRRSWLCDTTNVPGIIDARRVAGRIVPPIEGKPPPYGWSVGSCARSILKYVAPPAMWEKSANALLHESQFGYFDCQPGEFGAVAQYDVSGCYFELLSRLPSLRVSVLGHRLLWHSMKDAERERWADVLGEVRGAKLVRNAMLGCAVGKTERGAVYCGGVRKVGPMARGPFRAAGLLVVRSAWEMCRIASESTQSVYSAVDGVCVANDSKPSVWGDYGLQTRLVAWGNDADICSKGIYRIGAPAEPGHKATYWYRRGSRWRLSEPRAPAASRNFRDAWLHSN